MTKSGSMTMCFSESSLKRKKSKSRSSRSKSRTLSKRIERPRRRKTPKSSPKSRTPRARTPKKPKKSKSRKYSSKTLERILESLGLEKSKRKGLLKSAVDIITEFQEWAENNPKVATSVATVVAVIILSKLKSSGNTHMFDIAKNIFRAILPSSVMLEIADNLSSAYIGSSGNISDTDLDKLKIVISQGNYIAFRNELIRTLPSMNSNQLNSLIIFADLARSISTDHNLTEKTKYIDYMINIMVIKIRDYYLETNDASAHVGKIYYQNILKKLKAGFTEAFGSENKTIETRREALGKYIRRQLNNMGMSREDLMKILPDIKLEKTVSDAVVGFLSKHKDESDFTNPSTPYSVYPSRDSSPVVRTDVSATAESLPSSDSIPVIDSSSGNNLAVHS